MIEVELKYYSSTKKLYENTTLSINPGVTVLIGKNRSWENLLMLSD